MNRQTAIAYISYAVDDALSERPTKNIPHDARLIGWQCGFEPLFVAVWSYLGIRLDDSDAADIATDLLVEKGWFRDNDNPTEPDYII
jgi:hypothetical protein